jgi:hypothetical protein
MIQEHELSRSMSYEQYIEHIKELYDKGQATGIEKTEEHYESTKLNLQRMSRLNKTIVLSEDLKKSLSGIKNRFQWIVISEGWCGDASQNVPLFNAIAKACENIELKILLRDENPAIMDRYLTNGARSIPKLICISSNGKELFNWGPRPAALQAIAMDLKNKNVPKTEKGIIIQKWYNNDKTFSAQKELTDLIKQHMLI